MTLPLYILLIPYAIGLVVFLIGAGFNLWHLSQFGLFDFTGKLNAGIFIAMSLVIIGFTVLFLYNIPWGDSVNFLDMTTWQRVISPTANPVYGNSAVY